MLKDLPWEVQGVSNAKWSIHVVCARDFELACFLFEASLAVGVGPGLWLLPIAGLKYEVMRIWRMRIGCPEGGAEGRCFCIVGKLKGLGFS